MIPWFLNPHRSDDAKVISILTYYLAGTLYEALDWVREVSV
ncbi:MAG: hypothetical protein ACYCYO_01480 [Bacilli bacterium]